MLRLGWLAESLGKMRVVKRMAGGTGQDVPLVTPGQRSPYFESDKDAYPVVRVMQRAW